MALSIKIERRAFLWKVTTRTMPDAAGKPTSLDEIVSVLEGAFTAGTARVYLDGDGNLLDAGITPPNPKNSSTSLTSSETRRLAPSRSYSTVATPVGSTRRCSTRRQTRFAWSAQP